MPLPDSPAVLADALTAGEWGILGAFIGFALAVGAGFKWLIVTFLGELGNMRAAMKAEGDDNRQALTDLKNMFASKLDEISRENWANNQKLTDRQFVLSADSLKAHENTKAEICDVKKDVVVIRSELGEVKAEVHEVKTTLDRLAGPEPKRGKPNAG